MIRLLDEVIEPPQQLLRRYVKCHAYAAYDRDGAPAPGDDPDTLTSRQRQAVNGWQGMRMARCSPAPFWERWSGHPLPELQQIPYDLDLIDGRDAEVEAGIAAICTLVSRMAEMYRVGDVLPTKALHLLRPRFVAISDSLVRPWLCIREPNYTLDDNLWYAEQAVAVQRAMRRLGPTNEPMLTELHAYANGLPAVTTPLSKVRILDMVLWLHARLNSN